MCVCVCARALVCVCADYAQFILKIYIGKYMGRLFFANLPHGESLLRRCGKLLDIIIKFIFSLLFKLGG